METLALAMYAAWLFAAFGVRTVVQWRRTGDTGWRGVSGRFGSPEWFAGVLFAVAVIVGALGPILVLVGHHPMNEPNFLQALGTLLALAGIALTIAAQLSMRDSWRIGVDASERTELRTSGMFRWVRNPIFTAMVITASGMLLMVPTLVSVVGLVALIVAVHLQVRVVEEPYLLRTHEENYENYCGMAGRFVPRIGSR
jgi:protein-S-isoprenylcysteine O-methyltransferase Ste14